MIQIIITSDQDAFGDDVCRDISQLSTDTLRLVTVIDLQSCGITDTGIIYLSEAIPKMRRLKVLLLGENMLRDDGAKLLSMCLELKDVEVCLDENHGISEQVKDALRVTGRNWL